MKRGSWSTSDSAGAVALEILRGVILKYPEEPLAGFPDKMQAN